MKKVKNLRLSDLIREAYQPAEFDNVTRQASQKAKSVVANDPGTLVYIQGLEDFARQSGRTSPVDLQQIIQIATGTPGEVPPINPQQHTASPSDIKALGQSMPDPVSAPAPERPQPSMMKGLPALKPVPPSQQEFSPWSMPLSATPGIDALASGPQGFTVSAPPSTTGPEAAQAYLDRPQQAQPGIGQRAKDWASDQWSQAKQVPGEFMNYLKGAPGVNAPVGDLEMDPSLAAKAQANKMTPRPINLNPKDPTMRAHRSRSRLPTLREILLKK